MPLDRFFLPLQPRKPSLQGNRESGSRSHHNGQANPLLRTGPARSTPTTRGPPSIRLQDELFPFIINSTPFARLLYSYWGLEDLWLLSLFGVPRNPLAASGRLRIDTRLGLTRHTPSHTLRWSRRRIKVSHQTL